MAETAIADPPRFRWLKRGTVVGISVILVVAGARWWWGREAQRRLDAFVAATHTRGEPILNTDFDSAHVPQNDNAAATYLKAAAAIRYTPDENRWQAAFSSLSTSEDFVMMHQITAHNSGVLAMARTARVQYGTDWGVRLRHPVFLTMLRHLNPARNLAEFLGFAARTAQVEGNDHESIERLRDIMREGRAMDEKPPLLIAHLVAVGVNALASQTAIDLAPRLRVANSQAGTELIGTLASPAEVRALIDDLLDDRAQREGAKWAWQGEAMSNLEAADYATTPSVSNCPRPLMQLIKPMFILDGLRGARRDQLIASSVDVPNLQSARAQLQSFVIATSDLSHLEMIASYVSLSLGDSTQVVEQDFRAITIRRAAATNLALRLYQADHHGAFPTTLEKLSPGYLKSLPADPMRLDGQSFGYLPDAQPPILYSVGRNGTDDGGSTQPMRMSELGLFNRSGSSPWDCQDVVFPLWTAAGGNSTEP